MKEGLVILSIIFLLILSFSTYSETICSSIYHGVCRQGECPDNYFSMTDDNDPSDDWICSGYGGDEGGITGDAITDITGMDVDSIDCCVERRQESYCGDGVINEDEQCETADLNDKSCNDFLNFNAGELRCNNDCRFDTGYCFYQNRENTLIVTPDDLRMCQSEDSKGVVIRFTNNNDEILDNVYIYDTVFYDSDCDGEGRVYLDYENMEFSCGGIRSGSSCIKNYDITYYYYGCYYHNVYASTGRADYFIEG